MTAIEIETTGEGEPPPKTLAEQERMLDAILGRPKVQSEPSDAQVEAALDAYMAHEGWETDEVGKAKMRGRMRSALRAAGSVR